MLNLNHHIKELSNILLIIMLIVLQLFSLSFLTFYGTNESKKNGTSTHSIGSISEYPIEPILTKKDSKELQILIPFLDKQKYRIVSKYKIYYKKLLLLTCFNEKEKFYLLEIDCNNLIPRSPPMYLA
ncbi:MAG TPA: hypothetical protein DHV28_16575 [Ignavibacteriales bacterium]|nr:hypothetical protein [Ignavibacteriales bacterium]